MVEAIPGDDLVSRLVDSPHKWTPAELKFVDAKLFEFPSQEPFESVVWRKYAPDLTAVHAIGCGMQTKRRERRPDWTYEGAVSAIAAEIRAIRNLPGGAFSVEHAPEEGRHFHAHVGYVLVEGTQNLKQRKLDLKEALRNVFLARGIERHACA